MRDASAAPLTAEAKTATRAESAKVAATREPLGSHRRLCTMPPALRRVEIVQDLVKCFFFTTFSQDFLEVTPDAHLDNEKIEAI